MENDDILFYPTINRVVVVSERAKEKFYKLFGDIYSRHRRIKIYNNKGFWEYDLPRPQDYGIIVATWKASLETKHEQA